MNKTKLKIIPINNDDKIIVAIRNLVVLRKNKWKHF